jgi:hypothetical protein
MEKVGVIDLLFMELTSLNYPEQKSRAINSGDVIEGLIVFTK